MSHASARPSGQVSPGFDLRDVIFENRGLPKSTSGSIVSNTDSPAMDLTDPGSFRHWTRVTIRFGDEDRMGHVNNAAYAVWLEASRVAYLESFYDAGPRLDIVLARLTIDYLQETTWPGEVNIGARLRSVGRKSLQSVYGVFREDVCLATCECVNVFFDPKLRVSRTPPDEVRAALSAALP